MKYCVKRIKHYIEYLLIVVLFKLFKILGYEKSSNFMGQLAVLILSPMPIFKRMCNDIKLSSLRIPEDSIKNIATRSLNNFGRYIAEFQFVHSWSKSDLNKYVKVFGEEHLTNIGKKSSLVLTSHHANWEVIVRYFYFRKEKIRVVNRSMNNLLVNELLFKIRSHKKYFEYIDKNNASKKLIDSILNKYVIGMLADVKLQGKLLNFLGRKAHCSDIIARLYCKYKLNIIPCNVTRVNDHCFTINFHPPVIFNEDDVKNSDYQAMTTQVNKIYEKWIAENPSQWYWLHNRWKI